MKTVKYQSAIVKKPWAFTAQATPGKCYFQLGDVAICIPQNECYVDVAKITKSPLDLAELFDDDADAVGLERTGIGYISEDVVYVELAGKDRFRWVKQSNLKPFLKEGFTLLDAEKVVQVYEVDSGQVVAVIAKVDMEKIKT